MADKEDAWRVVWVDPDQLRQHGYAVIESKGRKYPAYPPFLIRIRMGLVYYDFKDTDEKPFYEWPSRDRYEVDIYLDAPTSTEERNTLLNFVMAETEEIVGDPKLRGRGWGYGEFRGRNYDNGELAYLSEADRQRLGV